MHDRLRLSRKRAGYKTGTAAWQALKKAGHVISKQTYLQHENGTRSNFHHWVPIYAEFYGVAVDWLMTGRGELNFSPRSGVALSNIVSGHGSNSVSHPKTAGRVAAGVFRTPETINQGIFQRQPEAPPVDPRYKVESQFDLVVEGESTNNFAKDGDVLRCIDTREGGVQLHDGDLVIVRRTSGNLVELAAKRWRRNGQGVELWCDSEDPRARVSHDIREDEEIVAVVIYSYRPARPMAALP